VTVEEVLWFGDLLLSCEFSVANQRRELLLHRRFVRDPLPADENDRFPYGDRLSLTTAEWPLRPEAIVPWSPQPVGGMLLGIATGRSCN
jgi:hypothetical protein